MLDSKLPPETASTSDQPFLSKATPSSVQRTKGTLPSLEAALDQKSSAQSAGVVSGGSLGAYQKFATDKLGITFKNIDLLLTAFTHRSYVNEHKKTVKEHNERMEFLGDAVLELVVTEYLFSHYNDPEGTLTNWRSALVRTESISAAATRFEFEPLLRLSRGEKRGTSRARAQILANCFEAVIGAVYLDQGYEAARRFIEASVITTFKEILETGSWMDAKSHLQELVQSQQGHTPIYKVLTEDGPDHEKIFKVGVFVNGKLHGEGIGPSKQAGQQQAAEAALKEYKE